MRFYIMRHAYPGPYIKEKSESDKQPLSDEGADAVRALAQWMAKPKRSEVPTSITCSPVTRALQTGKLLSQLLGVPYAVDPNLGRGKPMEMVMKAYANDKGVRRPLIVAHSDNLIDGLARLNYLASSEVDPMAMGELRVLKLDRDDFTWDEKFRVLPSDVGETDYY